MTLALANHALDTRCEGLGERPSRIGVKVFGRTPTLRFLLLTNVVVATGTAIVLVNFVVYAHAVFGLGEDALAVALACYGVGSLVVAVNIPRLVSKLGVIHTMTAGANVIVAGLAMAVIVTAVATTTGAGWYVPGHMGAAGHGYLAGEHSLIPAAR